MMSFQLTEKLSRFRDKPIIFKAQAVFDRLPFRPFAVSRFFLLSLDAVPEKGRGRGKALIRLATGDDIAGMSRLEDKPRQFAAWMESGHHCMVAVDGGDIVGFEWFSTAAFHHEERFHYHIPIPADAVYAFDAFIEKSYRLRGIWLQFKLFLRKWLEENGRSRIVTMIDYGNDASLKTHLRFGFHIYKDVHWVRLLGKDITFTREISLHNADLKRLLTK